MMIPSTAKEKEEQQWTSTSSLHQQKLQHPYPDSNCRPVSTTAAAATTTATIATAHKHITQEADNALLWASMLNENGRRSFMLEGLNEALVPRAMQDNCCTTSSGDTRRNRNVNGTPSINSLADDEDDDQQQPPLYHSSRRIKPESHGMFAPLPLETQIFTNLPAITITGDSSSSKISSFMDLLRQSDSTATTTTTAAAAAAEETHDMWIAHSSRLPAMLSQLLPSQSPPPSSSSSSSSHTTLDSNRKRVMMSECSPSSSSQSKRPHLQPGTSKKIQDDDEEPSKQLPSTDDLLSTTTTTSSSSSQLLIPKRPKIESNSSYPFKMQVRKEKLGERISALQQLVSPFGKTDTASVLLEAIGYIKFLHEQVQVLSSPYMKGVSNSSSRHHGDGKYSSWISSSPSSSEKEGEEDLRSRGLCLVPVTCTLQVANDNGADYWAPTIHGGSQLK